MAKQTRSTIKGWFQAGMKPLAAQFADWIDSFWHKDDVIEISNVNGLQSALDAAGGGGGGGTVTTVSNGGTLVLTSSEMIRFMLIRSASSQTIKCGTSAGGSQIFNYVVDSSGTIHEEVFAPASGLTLHFTCSSSFSLYIQKITFS